MVLIMHCFFVSDLHGSHGRYTQLFQYVQKKKPDAVFIGGDLLNLKMNSDGDTNQFIETDLFKNIKRIRRQTAKEIRFFIILGNDDPRVYEHLFQEADDEHIIEYIHQKTVSFEDLFVTGYSYVPPTPFQLKDWERYDVSKYVDVGSTPLEDGFRTVDTDKDIVSDQTIAQDIMELSKNAPVYRTIFLFHSPPYDTLLDIADINGRMVDHVPLDVHIGSIALKRFIINKQPFLTLHGHAHESTRLSGHWKQRFGKTFSFNAAHDGASLSVIHFDTTSLLDAYRSILPVDLG